MEIALLLTIGFLAYATWNLDNPAVTPAHEARDSYKLLCRIQWALLLVLAWKANAWLVELRVLVDSCR